MGAYEDALQRLARYSQAQQEIEVVQSSEFNSDIPLYRQKIQAQNRADINIRVRQSVDYDEQGLLDRAIVLPGRLAHEALTGFVDSSADMIELPELLVNAVGDKFGWEEEDRLHVLGSVADSIRNSVDRTQAQKSIAEKIAYYVGYSVPDLVGMLAGGLGGAKVAGRIAAKQIGEETLGSVARAQLKKTLRVSAPTAKKVGQVMGTIGYGTLKGGAFGGTEGALHSARDFTAMEIGMWALSRYSKPVQIAGTAAMMGFLTSATMDQNRPDYQDEIIANAVLGGLFAAVPNGKKRKILEDPDLSLAKAKAWTARQRASGKNPNINDAIAEFSHRDWGYLHQSYRQDPRAKLPIQDLYENLQRHIGTKDIPKNTEGMTRALAQVLRESGEITTDRALTFAEQFVRSAELLSDPMTPGGPDAIKPFIDAHRDVLVNPTPEGTAVLGTTTITTESGVVQKVTEKVAREYKEDVARREVERRQLMKIEEDRRKTPFKLLSQGWDYLVNPIGSKIEKKLMAIPLGEKVLDLVKYKSYDVYDGALAKENAARERVGFKNFSEEARTKLDEIINIGMLEDRFLYDEFKGKVRIHEWSPEFTQAKKREFFEWVEQNEGKAAVERYMQAADALFQENQAINKRLLDAGLITESSYRNYTSSEYLPNGRAPRWRQNKSFVEVENVLTVKDDPIFQETFNVNKLDPRLKKNSGDILIHDAEYLLMDRIRKTEYAIAKNNLIHSYGELAQSKDVYAREFARPVEYDVRIKGKKDILSPEEVRKIEANNARLTKAAKEARNRRLEKLKEGEYAPKGKKGKPAKSIESLQKEIKDLQAKVLKAQDKFEKTEAHLQGDFSKYDVPAKQISETTHPKDVVIHEDTPAYRETKAIRDELLNQLEQLESLNQKVVLEYTPRKVEGFQEVKYLKNGEPASVMINDEAAHMLNLNHGLSKQQIKIQKILGFASGTIPVKFLATAINPVFAMRSFWRDNHHFFVGDFNETSMLTYMKDVMLRQPAVFKDVVTKGPLMKKYSELGLNQLTVTKTVKEDMLLKRGRAMLPEGQGKAAWENFVDKMGWLGTNLEMTVRLSNADALVKKGIPPEKAVRLVNDHMNFGRKGNVMRWIDTVYPYANVAAQALDSQLRAFKTNPKKFGAKMAQYWALRLSAAAAAYAVSSEVMDQVSPYQKVNNFIIPIGASTEDRLGDIQHAYVAIPTENSPLIRAIDSLMFGAIDVIRDGTNTLTYQEIINRLADDVPLYDVSGFAPALQAYKAIFDNRDPRTGDNIWKGSYLVDPSLRSYPDTSQAAVAAAQVLPGASPVGIERAAAQFKGNPLISFFGYMMRDTTQEEKNSMTRTVTEAVPGLNSIVKWTKPQMLATRIMQQEGASNRQKLVGSKVDFYTKALQEDIYTNAEVLSEVRANSELNTLEKQDVLKLTRQNMEGWKLYKRVKEKESPEVISTLPSLREWQSVGRSNSETKALWFYKMKPEKGDPSFGAFNVLAKAHGMLKSQEFFYYLRQAEKGSRI